MSATLFWVLAGFAAVAFVALLVADAPAPPVRPETGPDDMALTGASANTVEVIEADCDIVSDGPHTIIRRGEVDEGEFVLVRTPLYDYPFNRSLFTQVFTEPSGLMIRARYCVIDTVETGLLEIGFQNATPVTIIIGNSVAIARFADTPETTWTH